MVPGLVLAALYVLAISLASAVPGLGPTRFGTLLAMSGLGLACGAAVWALHRRGLLEVGGCCAEDDGPGAFSSLLDQLAERDWVVYAKRPFGGPAQVLAYLARYFDLVEVNASFYRLPAPARPITDYFREAGYFTAIRGKVEKVAKMLKISQNKGSTP